MVTQEEDSSHLALNRGQFHRFFLVYVTFSVILTLVHLALLLWQQTLVLEELNFSGGSEMAWVHSIPTWIPFVVLLLLILFIQPCLLCGWCFETSKEKKENSWQIIVLNCRINIVITLVVGVVCHIIQVIVYLWIDILAYLDSHPITAACYCHPVVPDLCNDLHQCHCDLPFTDKVYSVVTSDPGSLGTGNDTSDLNYQGHVDLTLGNQTIDVHGHQEYPELDRMILLLQLVLAVTTLRFPAWIIMAHKDMLKNKLKLIRKISKDYKISKGDDQHRKDWNWKGVVCASIAAKKLSKEYRVRELTNAWFVLEVCFYCYVEGADAFTLVEEIIQKSDYFVNDRTLTNALLFFISLTLLITSTANLLALMPTLSNWLSVFTRLLLVILSNLPLFILRIYMFQVVEGITSADVVFVLFTIKEIMLILLAIAQAVIEYYNVKLTEEENVEMPEFCTRPSEVTLETTYNEDENED